MHGQFTRAQINFVRFFLNRINKTFENVKYLYIYLSQLNETIDLSTWFPNLGRLELHHIFCCIQTVSSYPHLNYLSMDIKSFSTTCFKKLIQSATNLETLRLNGSIEFELLQFVSNTSNKLKNLYLWDFLLKDETNDVIMFDSVQTLIISN